MWSVSSTANSKTVKCWSYNFRTAPGLCGDSGKDLRSIYVEREAKDRYSIHYFQVKTTALKAKLGDSNTFGLGKHFNQYTILQTSSCDDYSDCYFHYTLLPSDSSLSPKMHYSSPLSDFSPS